MESIGHYIRLGQQILVELNPNILVGDAIIMGYVERGGGPYLP